MASGHRRNASQDMSNFKEMTKQQAVESCQRELSKLLLTARTTEDKNIAEKEFEGFIRIFQKFILLDKPTVDWEKIEILPDNVIKSYPEPKKPLSDEEISKCLSKIIVLKLNGGLGTSMGCTGPKSAIPVRADHTFLDMTVQQIEYLNTKYNVNIPLVLMNSFNTDADTKDILARYANINVAIHCFLQSRHPRFSRDSFLPIPKSLGDVTEVWYPPGHGDVYDSFYNSGLLDFFLKEGKQFVFLSNIDNLGATIDFNILNFLLNEGPEPAPSFVMEVTDKTRADVKGGTLVKYENKLRLLEIAQVPKDFEEVFKSVNKFKIFNTNNLWLSLAAIKNVIETDTLDMEVIVNPKSIESKNGPSQAVLQLERAAGAAIKCFDNAIGINVPRSRFLPVKTTADLLLAMSNLYHMKSGALAMSPKRSFPSVPLVKLGTEFQKVKDFLKRFSTIPDLLEIDHLTVSGDVTFGRGVCLKGTVIIIANHGERIDIPPGAFLENKIVSGNLRILNH